MDVGGCRAKRMAKSVWYVEMLDEAQLSRTMKKIMHSFGDPFNLARTQTLRGTMGTL